MSSRGFVRALQVIRPSFFRPSVCVGPQSLIDFVRADQQFPSGRTYPRVSLGRALQLTYIPIVAVTGQLLFNRAFVC